MQMHKVETSAGTAICAAPSRIASYTWIPIFQVTLDIFDGDGGIVHQDSHGESQAAQGHDVDGFMQEAESKDGGKDRKRNGNRDDQGAAPTAQEEQNHQAGQHGGDDRPRGPRRSLHAPRRSLDPAAAASSIAGARSRQCAAAAGAHPCTTLMVEALPAFRTRTRTPRCPSWRAMLVCGEKPSLTVATSRR